MKTSTPLLFLLLFGLLLGACKSSESAVDAPPMSVEQEIVERHIAAIGGRATLESIESLQLMGELYMPAAGMTLPLTLTQKRPAKMHVRVDVAAMGAEVLNGYDGETAWQVNPLQGGTQKLSGEQARNLKEQADIDGLLVDYEAKGYSVAYVGEEEVKGTNTQKLQVMRPDSSEVFVYLDAATALQFKVESEGTNPMTGAKAKSETYMSDYRDVDGMMVPFSLEVHFDGQLFQTVTLSDVKTNVEVDDAIFMYPKN